MTQLYSITGLFYDLISDVTPWGGYFIKGVEVSDDSKILGQLIDSFGASHLDGYLYEESLAFRKTYVNSTPYHYFDYSFVLKNGIWQGEFISPFGYGSKAMCNTHLCIDQLEIIQSAEFDEGKTVNNLINMMIQSGTLTSYINPDTGEEMIGLIE